MISINKYLNDIPIGFEFKTIVISNSMSPFFKKGDKLLVKAIPFQKIKIGDIILFNSIQFKTLVTHRVVEIKQKKLFTKGDANQIQDKTPTIRKNYIGKIVKVFK